MRNMSELFNSYHTATANGNEPKWQTNITQTLIHIVNALTLFVSANAGNQLISKTKEMVQVGVQIGTSAVVEEDARNMAVEMVATLLERKEAEIREMPVWSCVCFSLFTLS